MPSRRDLLKYIGLAPLAAWLSSRVMAEPADEFRVIVDPPWQHNPGVSEWDVVYDESNNHASVDDEPALFATSHPYPKRECWGPRCRSYGKPHLAPWECSIRLTAAELHERTAEAMRPWDDLCEYSLTTDDGDHAVTRSAFPPTPQDTRQLLADRYVGVVFAADAPRGTCHVLDRRRPYQGDVLLTLRDPSRLVTDADVNLDVYAHPDGTVSIDPKWTVVEPSADTFSVAIEDGEYVRRDHGGANITEPVRMEVASVEEWTNVGGRWVRLK